MHCSKMCTPMIKRINVSAMLGGMCDPLLKQNYMQPCYNNHNGIQLAFIGSSDRDALPEQEELVSAHANKLIQI